MSYIYKKYHIVCFSWLLDKISGYVLTGHEEVDSVKLDCVARGYILFPFGCTLFVDKSGHRVNECYLRYLEDVKKSRIMLGMPLA